MGYTDQEQVRKGLPIAIKHHIHKTTWPVGCNSTMKKTSEELGRKYRTVFILFQKYPQTAAGHKITFGLSVLQY